ncbi:MAG: ArsC/Spx/MgsR family protein [Paracoccaceae bacterium]|jgi:arsenate reductase
MQLYGLKTCDTTRNALKTLREAGLQVTYIDVRSDGVSEELLDKLFAVFGNELVNKRSTTWRGLGESGRAGDSRALLLAHPVLMKRPVICAGDDLYLGWGSDVQAALIG